MQLVHEFGHPLVQTPLVQGVDAVDPSTSFRIPVKLVRIARLAFSLGLKTSCRSCKSTVMTRPLSHSMTPVQLHGSVRYAAPWHAAGLALAK